MQTQGSLITPAECNNVVGIKPTVGLVSRDSIVPVSLDRDTVGPLARTVLDAAAILNVIAGRDENDPATDRILFEEIPDYTKFCTTSGFSKMHLGIPQNALEDVPVHILTYFNDTARRLQELGAQVVDVEFPAVNEYNSLTFKEKVFPMAAEFRPSISGYLGSLEQNPKDLRSLEDIYRLTKSDPREYFPNRDLGLPMISVPLGYLLKGTPVKWNERHDTITQAPNRP